MTVIDMPRPSRMRTIFNNRLVRFVSLFLITIFAYAGAQIFPMVTMPHIPAPNRESFAVVTEAVSVILLLLIYRSFVRWMEHRTPQEIAVRKIPSVIPGVLIGLGLFTATIAILSVMGIAHIGAYTPAQALLAAINMAVLSAVGEEIIFRGVVFRIAEEMFGTLVALLVSAGLFGLIHMGNPGATLVSGAAIALEAGILLAVSYMLTRSLWLPIGLHFGWNFAEGGIFGAAVSGNNFKGLWSTTFTGPDLLSGGKFGPEASIVAVAVCAAAATVILALAIRNGQWRPLHLSINDRG
ncbi:MAG TPA: CPBP family intramembrane glutamic endopeptidase [Rhizomicrobium sp.]|nr:CPBP family intramembrane glutamic endopeptidase [Rhizomicrobium sp.]